MCMGGWGSVVRLVASGREVSWLLMYMASMKAWRSRVVVGIGRHVADDMCWGAKHDCNLQPVSSAL
jgi:hypothetical protein